MAVATSPTPSRCAISQAHLAAHLACAAGDDRGANHHASPVGHQFDEALFIVVAFRAIDARDVPSRDGDRVAESARARSPLVEPDLRDFGIREGDPRHRIGPAGGAARQQRVPRRLECLPPGHVRKLLAARAHRRPRRYAGRWCVAGRRRRCRASECATPARSSARPARFGRRPRRPAGISPRAPPPSGIRRPATMSVRASCLTETARPLNEADALTLEDALEDAPPPRGRRAGARGAPRS